MQVQIPVSIGATKAFVSKDGRSFVKVSCSAAGFGIFQFVVAAHKVPDEIEGKTLVARFSCYVARDFSLKIGFDAFIEEINNA